MAQFINLTGHDINLPEGQVIKSEVVLGDAPRVIDIFGPFDADGICFVTYGEIKNLPAPQAGTIYVVSAMVLAAAHAAGRTDCVAPATGHPSAKKNEKGHILEVPGFVRR